MSLAMKPGKGIAHLAMILALGFGLLSSYTAFAQDTAPAESQNQSSGSESWRQLQFAGQESDGPAQPRTELESTLFGTLSKIFIFLLVLAGVAAGVIHYARKGKLNLNSLKPIGIDNRLIIAETKALGGRQFLLVAEYNDQRILLGVSPGRIDHICFLESFYEEELRDADSGDSAFDSMNTGQRE